MEGPKSGDPISLGAMTEAYKDGNRDGGGQYSGPAA